MEQIKKTLTFNHYEHYVNSYLLNSEFYKNASLWRDFASGKQYKNNDDKRNPRPVFNIVGEAVNKITAKILGTPYHVSFVSDNEDDLSNIDLFYEYQMNAIKNKQVQAMVVREAVITGIGVSITSWDEDTFGSKGLFKGFLKKQVLYFEDCYFSNPYNQDIQDNAYLGFKQVLEIGTVKKLIKGFKEKEVKEIEKAIVPDNYYEDIGNYQEMSIDELERESCTVFTEFFRIDGEVYFKLATKYVELFKKPIALNPNKSIEEDIEIDGNKNLIFTSPKKNNDEKYNKLKSKFSLYPMQVYTPLPIIGRVNGESIIAQFIPNQKLINYMSLMTTLIMRNHAVPKYIAKSDALRGQIIDNDPSKIIFDYSKNYSGGWGIQRLNAGDAINNNLIEMMLSVVSLTRNLNGTDDLTSSANSSNSGYAYEQRVKQANLVLEQPQARFWDYIADSAMIDISFFKHFMDNGKFYYFLDDSEYETNEQYRQMSQEFLDKQNVEQGENFIDLPKTNHIKVSDVDEKMFDKDFAVSIEVEEGIVGSQISESQHYNQIMQYALSGNSDASLIKAMVLGDPAVSAKTKKRVRNYLETIELSQINMLKEQNAMLQQEIIKMQQTQEKANSILKYMGSYVNAKDKAIKEQDKVNKSIISDLTNKELYSEGKVKSNNAKGESGSSFSR